LRLSDLTVEVRDKNLARLGVIRPEELNLTVADAHNNVGPWSLKLASEHPLANSLRTPGAGIIVTGPDDVLFSGPVVKPAFESNGEDPAGTLVFEGVTDTVALADALAWPQPGNPDPTTQTTSHDVRTGVAETLMHAYVNANIGPGAPLARQKAKLTLGTDGLRGPSLTKRARFPVLGNLLHELAVVSDLGFRVVQHGSGLVFETYAVADRTKLIRLDVLNGTLASQAVAVSAPGATRVIVAGQGELVDRQFVARDNTESIEAETSWGRRIERFVDQRQTSDVAELQQAGDELLAEEGFTAVSVKAVPMDDTTMVFGKDWGLGDRVTVVVEGQEEVTSTVTGYVLKASAEGFKVGAVLGDPNDFDPQAALSKRVQGTEGRVSALERTASSEGHAHRFLPPPATKPVDVYPLGVSQGTVPADGTWPSNFGTVLTVKDHACRAWQIFGQKVGPAYYRSSDCGPWLPWQRLATSAEIATLPRGVKAAVNYGFTGTHGTTEVVFDPLSFTAEAGRVYEVTWSIDIVDDQSGANSNPPLPTGKVRLYLRHEVNGAAVTTASPALASTHVTTYGHGSGDAEGAHLTGLLINPPAGTVTVAQGGFCTHITGWRLFGRRVIVKDIGPA
jgi:hypothetical protein